MTGRARSSSTGVAAISPKPVFHALETQLFDNDLHGWGESDREEDVQNAPIDLIPLASQDWIPKAGVLVKDRLLKPRKAAQPLQLSRHIAHRVRNQHKAIPPVTNPTYPVYYKASDLNCIGFEVRGDGACLITIKSPISGKNTVHVLDTQYLNIRESRRTPTASQTLKDLVLVSIYEDELPSYKFWKDADATVITDPNLTMIKSLADHIDDEIAAKRLQEMRANSQRHISMKNLHMMPTVSPTDKAWTDTYAYYTRILKRYNHDTDRSKSLMAIIDANFTAIQKSLVLPTMYVNSEFDQILSSNETRYDCAFIKGGRFEGIPKNLIAKFTMLHFGLPVAPLGMNEVIWASDTEPDIEPATGLVKKNDNNLDQVKPKWSPQESVWPDDVVDVTEYTQKVLWALKPLEFLDTYYERFCGYPGLRGACFCSPFYDC